MSLTQFLYPILASSGGYNLLQKALGRDAAVVSFVAECLRAQPGEAILDVGCGTANVLNFLPVGNYVGIDSDEAYIANAQKHFGKRGRFICQDISSRWPLNDAPTFDAVIAVGVLHHLADEDVHFVCESAKRVLKPGGRFATLDGCYRPNQHWLDRWMLDNDRGEFVRNKESYVKLVGEHFPHVDAVLRDDLFNVPHTLILMSCRQRVESRSYAFSSREHASDRSASAPGGEFAVTQSRHRD